MQEPGTTKEPLCHPAGGPRPTTAHPIVLATALSMAPTVAPTVAPTARLTAPPS
jgi:hypothetical protein